MALYFKEENLVGLYTTDLYGYVFLTILLWTVWLVLLEAINFIKFPVFGPVYISEVWITRLELMQAVLFHTACLKWLTSSESNLHMVVCIRTPIRLFGGKAEAGTAIVASRDPAWLDSWVVCSMLGGIWFLVTGGFKDLPEYLPSASVLSRWGRSGL